MPDNDQYEYSLGQPFFTHHGLLSMVDTYFERLLVRPDLGFADHNIDTMGMGRVLALPIDFGRHVAAKPLHVNMVQRAPPPRRGPPLEPSAWPGGMNAPPPSPPHTASITQYTLRDPADWFADAWDGHHLGPRAVDKAYHFDWSDGNRDRSWRNM